MTKLSSDQRNKLNDSDFGIPEERMYPLHDKAHVESAAKLFGHADAKYKKSLARKILRRAKDFNIDTSGWSEVLKYAQEQVPPMSDGTSLGNASPSTFAAYNEEDELASRADQLAGNVDIEMTVELAREIAYKIHEQTKRDAKPPVGNQNCQLCTWCAEAQFRGMDVVPRPVYSPRDPVLGIPGETIVLHPIKLPIRNNDDAVTRVKEAGHGARYYVHVNWKGSEGGHEFLLINIAFQVYLMDAQAGIVENVDENERYFNDTNFANSYMARLDDHHLNSYLLKDATDPSKTLPWDSAKDIPYMRENGLLGEDEEIPEDGAVQEAACNASLLNVKNQLMNKLSGEFEFIGGSLVPKFTMKSNEKPDVAFEVNVNGQSIEVTPVINGMPDLLHKRRGIAIMCAANTIAEFARETVKNYKPVQESFMDEYEKEDPRFVRVMVPSDEAIPYMKEDPELSQYWEELNKSTQGVILVDRKTKKQIGHVFVHTNKKDKGFIFNLEVKPEYRRQGFGWILTDDAVRRLGGEDLTVDADNEPAIKLYTKYGFTVYKKGQWHYDPPKDELWMKFDRSKLKPIQEGAFQDIKNGVNPFSDDLVFHVSPDKHLDGQVWQPRVPDYLDPYNPDDTGFEDNTTPRICFSTSIEGALNGITVNIQRQSPDTFDKMYVYVPEKPWKKYKHKTNKELVDSKLVYDANVTREVWIMEPVRMKLYGVIRVDQVSDAKRKAVVPTASGQKDTRNYYTYKWHWVVKPKALEKATKFDYSAERVISDLCVDLKKFKYGLIKDGRLMTGNVSEADYDKYWVFHTGQEVDEAGGGNCYDMVEYEAGYLEAFGVSYKKYFMSSTKPGDETAETHTFVVVPLDGKFIYIEQAFKRVIDEWGHERQKSFDKLNDLFDYVAECSADFYGSDLNFGVWDYTDEQFTPGTPMHDFQNWIYKNCKMVYDGEAKQSAVKSEMDTFITIGDSMFYVSEYHNALFDDPDAHEEAICEFGLLLDSPDDEYFEETEKPYDDYLKKHGYDPRTNTILIPDPNDWSVSGGRKMIRVSAGRIGSKKERNRLNKFLRENGYDPETETIQTDINDKKNPGRKKRVKFEINPNNDGEMGAQWNEDENAFVNEKITMPPKSLQKKPYRSNQIFKHEEGHAAQYGDTARPARSFFGISLDDPEFVPNGEATKGVDKAKQHLSSMSDEDKSKIRVSHDLDPTEYHADAYGELHNRYSKRGNSSRRELMNAADEFEKKLNEMDRSIIKKGKQEARKKYREDETVLRKLLSLPGYPGTDVSDENWAKFLIANKKYIPKDKWPSIEGYLKYREQTDKLRDKVRELQKKARAAGMDPDSDEWDDFYFENIKPIHDEIKKIRDQADGALDGSSYVFSTKDLAKEAEKRGIDNLFSEKIGRSAQEYIDYKKKEKAGVKYRDPDEMRFAHQKRGEYAQQVWDERDKQQKAQAAKQRQLSKEQLQQQIASGKLTKDQAAKAERKIQKIEAFEKQQAEYGPNAQPKPVKKKPAAKQDTIAVANQSLTTPASKEEKGAKSQSQSTTKKEG